MRYIKIAFLFILAMSAGTSAQKATPTPDRTAVEAEIARIAAENKKIEDGNAAVAAAFKAGNEAYSAKNYDAAIAAYDPAIKAYPDHPGTITLLTNKAHAQVARGNVAHNAAVAIKDPNARGPALDGAKVFWRAAEETSSKAVALAKANRDLTGVLREALVARAFAMRMIATKVDPTRVDGATAIYREAMAAVTDTFQLAQLQKDLANMLFDASAYDKALPEFEKILKTSPDDLTALHGAGMSIVILEDKPNMQRAADYLKRFLALAPATDDRRELAVEGLGMIKDTYNIVPK